MTDGDLIGQCLGGDRSAFDKIVLRYQDALYRHVLRLTGNREEAEDLCQEAFIRFYRALPGFDRACRVAPFLFKIATNLWRDGKRPQLVVVEEAGIGWAARHEPERDALEAVLRQDLLEAMDRLRPEYREVLSLRYDQGLTYREIAEVIGTTSGTVGTWLRRAVEALREALQVAEKEVAR